MSENLKKWAEMSEKEYRAHPGVNKSTLWEIRKSPAHYKWALENPSEDTPALRMGRVIHKLVLQPDSFDDEYAVAPSGIDRRTKAGKEAWERFSAEAEGKEIIPAEDFEEAKAIAFSVLSGAKDVLAHCVTEVPLFWDDDWTGIRCKCRVDAMKELDDKFLMIDLKTVADAGTDAFARDAYRYGYHAQAAHYINAVETLGLNHGKPIEWCFVVVEKKAPYLTRTFTASEDFIRAGKTVISGLLEKLNECMMFDTYPGYADEVLDLPRWVSEREDNE